MRFTPVVLFCLLSFFLATPHGGAAGSGSAEEGHARLGPPRDLLGNGYRWKKQSGEWTFDIAAGSAAGMAAGKLAEIAGEKAVRMQERWLSLRVKMETTTTKVGFVFTGAVDGSGQPLRFVLDPATATIADAQGRKLAPLPDGKERDRGVELVFNFTADKLTLHSGGAQLAEMEVRFPEGEVTPSLFVESGRATFCDLLLSAEARPAVEPAAVPSSGKKTPTAPTKKPANTKGARVLSVDFSPEKMTALKSGWNDYLGVHFETATGPWKMVRQYDGPEFGLPPRPRHPADLKQFTGPFSGNPVDSALSDFRDWKRKGARGLDENLAQLIRDNRAAVFIAPWASGFTKMQQDEVWALMKIAYGANVGAEGRLYFQWGDDINTRHLGTTSSTKAPSAKPLGGTRAGRGENVAMDAYAYAENYLAPAVEAVRRASGEIFHDPRRIPILSGSCALAGREENRKWFTSVLDHEINGDSAPTLKGQRVIDLVDYLTVNYPFASSDDDSALDELWERYGAKVKGIWITEEFGSGGRGASDLLARAARFFAWAGRNKLDAQQTRILFNQAHGSKSTSEVLDALRSIGESFSSAPLSIGLDEGEGRKVFRISAGDGKMLVVIAPATSARGARSDSIEKVAVEVSETQSGKAWVARMIQTSKKPADKAAEPVAIVREGTRLMLDCKIGSNETAAIWFEAP